MRPGCTLNLLEANLLSKQKHAFPTMARHYCHGSVCCWNLCSGFAEVLHSNILLHLYLWSWQFLCQFRTWNLPSGFIQTLPRMCYWSLRSDTSFPSSRRKWFGKSLFGKLSLKMLVRCRKETVTKMCKNEELWFCLYSAEISKNIS